MKTVYPKIYIYRRIVRAKLFIDDNYDRKINLDNIAGEACFSKAAWISPATGAMTIVGSPPFADIREMPPVGWE